MARERGANAGSDDGTPSLARLAAYFLRLGAFGFGGPIALAGYMQRDLVERRGWIAPLDFQQGLALAQLAPGPLAAQLAIYLGWVCGRLLGATVVAFAFILPSFVMVLALAAAYVELGGSPWMQGVFYGVGAAVIAIIARSAWKLGKATLGKRWRRRRCRLPRALELHPHRLERRLEGYDARHDRPREPHAARVLLLAQLAR